MTPKKKKLKPTVKQYDGAPVLFDCYSWILSNAVSKRTTITGPFRLALALSRDAHFWPAVLINSGTDLSPELETSRVALSRLLRKEILVLTPETIKSHPFKVWMSLAADHYCPLTPALPSRIHVVTVLHDIMSAQGVFGDRNAENFWQAVSMSDALLYVSDTTRKRFLELSTGVSVGTLIPFQNCHHYGNSSAIEPYLESTNDAKRVGVQSLSVHSLYRRKNIFRTLEVAQELLTTHLHCGQFFADCDFSTEEVEKFHAGHIGSKSEPPDFDYEPNADDQHLLDFMLMSNYFICASEDEGFSMPPMEAMICGVPCIFLSDIPVHREIYGDYEVNFFSAKLGDPVKTLSPKTITAEQRKEIFKRHSYENMVTPFLNYLHNIRNA